MLKREEEQQQNLGLLPFVFCEHQLFERVSEIIDISMNRALQVDRMLQHSKCWVPSKPTSCGIVARVILQDGQACSNNSHRWELSPISLAMAHSLEIIPRKTKSSSPISSVKLSPLPVSIFPLSSSPREMMTPWINFCTTRLIMYANYGI